MHRSAQPGDTVGLLQPIWIREESLTGCRIVCVLCGLCRDRQRYRNGQCGKLEGLAIAFSEPILGSNRRLTITQRLRLQLARRTRSVFEHLPCTPFSSQNFASMNQICHSAPGIVHTRS